MLGDSLREARKKAKFTQEKLAKEIGVQRSVISKYESGTIDPTVGQLQRIADALGVSVDYLLGTHHMKGILNYKTAAIRDRIFEAVTREDLSSEEFCLKLGLPIDEWFKWKEGSSTSYLDYLPEISKLLCIQEDILSGQKPDTVPPDRIRLTEAFDRLNPSGQKEAVKRVEELTEIPRYQKEKTPADGE